MCAPCSHCDTCEPMANTLASSQVMMIKAACVVNTTQPRQCPVQFSNWGCACVINKSSIIFDLGSAGLRTELKHIIKCRKRNQMGFPQ